MTTIRVHKVVKILLDDEHILSNWERLYEGLNIRDGSIIQLRIGFGIGTISGYTLFHNILSAWLSASGSDATMGTLSAILLKEGFVACAEWIGEFGPNCKLAAQDRVEAAMCAGDADIPVPSTGASGGNIFLPLTSEELEVALQNCRNRDTIVLAASTRYSGNFTMGTSGICITSGGPGAELMGKEPNKEVVTITGKDISFSGITVRSSRENCILILGTNNKIHECTLISAVADGCPALFIAGGNNDVEDITVIGGSAGVHVVGVSNRLVNLTINNCGKGGCCIRGQSNSLVGATIRNVTNGLIMGGEDKYCSEINAIAKQMGLQPSKECRKMRLEKSRFECGGKYANAIHGDSHTIKEVEFKRILLVHGTQSGSSSLLENCSGFQLIIEKGGKVIQKNCTFKEVENDNDEVEGCRIF